MKLRIVNVSNFSCVLISAENLTDVAYADKVFDGLIEEVPDHGDVDELYKEFTANYIEQFLIGLIKNDMELEMSGSMQQIVYELYEHMGHIMDYMITNHWLFLIMGGLTIRINECSFYDMLKEINSANHKDLVVFGKESDGFQYGLTKISKLCAKELTGKSGITPINKLKDTDLYLKVLRVFLDNRSGDEPLKDIEQYFKPTQFKVKFANTHDMMKYCSTQDLSSIIKCKGDSVIQKYEDSGQLVFASDYGKAGIV